MNQQNTNGVPSLAELDCEAVLASEIDLAAAIETPAAPVPNPHRKAKKPKRERVINKDLSVDMDRGTFARPVAVQPACATDLTDNQIYRLFELRLHYGTPAGLCSSMYRFLPSPDDTDHIHTVCLWNFREWIGHLAPWYVPAEAFHTLADSLAAFRKAFADRDPVRAAFFAVCERVVNGELVRPCKEYRDAEAAVEAMRTRELDDRRKRMGMSPYWTERSNSIERQNLLR